MCLNDDTRFNEPPLPLSRFTSDGGAAEYRRRLLLLNRERIEFSYEKARANGLDNPTILVLDLLDDRASRLAHLIGVSSERIAQCREACHGPGVAPVYVVSLTPPAAICLVGPSTRLSPQGIAKPCPPGTFRVVVMAADGNAFADFPLPPIANITIE